MPTSTPLERYTRTAMALHWTIALLLVVNVALALSFDLWPDERVRSIVDLHKSTGITVLGLVLLRILWRIAHRPPAFPAAYPRHERLAAHATHAVLYALMLGLPLSGWFHDSAWKDAATHPMALFGLVPWPRVGWIVDLPPVDRETWHERLGALHTWLGYLLYAAVGLHLAGALKHQLLDGHAELARMWPARTTDDKRKHRVAR